MKCAGYATSWKPMLALASALSLAACTKTMGTVETSCLVWQPVSWSLKDTPQTVEEVKANNARRAAWCHSR